MNITRVYTPIPSSILKILQFLKTRGINFFSAPQFEKGIIIGEKNNEVHITPEKAKILDEIIKNYKPKKG